MGDQEALRGKLSAMHAEALRVGDSPIRADRLADQLDRLTAEVESADITEEQNARISAALRDAVRVLRRDDDGREAARHLQTAQRQLEYRPSQPSPFFDDR